MKRVVNKWIPFSGYKAMCIWPFLFVRSGAAWSFTKIDERHERIHGEQQKEMLLLPFYLWYGIEWLIRLCIYRDSHKAYRNISFEQEAYENQEDIMYLERRRHFAWLKYLKR